MATERAEFGVRPITPEILAGQQRIADTFLALGLLTYVLVNLTWVFFRAKTFGKAWTVLGGMVGQHATARTTASSGSGSKRATRTPPRPTA